MYEKFLERLEEIREYEWSNYDIKIQEEMKKEDGFLHTQQGVRNGENALEAIARHMVEVLEER